MARPLRMAAEATYRRGAAFSDSFRPQVEILRQADPDAIICVATYSASAGFIRDARDGEAIDPDQRPGLVRRGDRQVRKAQGGLGLDLALAGGWARRRLCVRSRRADVVICFEPGRRPVTEMALLAHFWPGGSRRLKGPTASDTKPATQWP